MGGRREMRPQDRGCASSRARQLFGKRGAPGAAGLRAALAAVSLSGCHCFADPAKAARRSPYSVDRSEGSTLGAHNLTTAPPAISAAALGRG